MMLSALTLFEQLRSSEPDKPDAQPKLVNKSLRDRRSYRGQDQALVAATNRK